MTPDSEEINFKELRELKKELAKKEQELQDIYEKLTIYESAASGANDGLWDWDFVNNNTFVSAPWKTMLGISPTQELDSTAWTQLLHPDDKAGALEAFDDFVSGKSRNYNLEFRMRHTDGSYRWILSKAKAIRDERGRALRISGSHTDITERREAEERIKQSEEKYKTLFQNSLVSMFRYNFQTGEIIQSNQKLCALLNEEKVIGNNFYTYLYDKDTENVLKGFDERINIENQEFQLKTRSEEVIWVALSGKYYHDQGEVDVVLKDITQTKESLLELQKVNFELDSFVYHASHDLRSPLRSVLGLIDLYRLEDNQNVQDECIDKIEGSVRRLDHLVMDLLSISRNDRVNEPKKEINLLLEINNSITSYYNALNTENLDIRVKVYNAIKFVSDTTRVRIILNNLISNAIKYRSFQKDLSYVSVEAKVTDEEATITIEDNGEGIEQNKLPHIFDMFYRATEKSEGSGLGLYIVKKVGDKLGAKIEVDSIELEGTTFTVRIPNSIKSEEYVST